jgi:DNA-binding transcriptional regulator LsrR (DeoR family)
LDGKDRLRLSYYYVQELTLAEIGRLLKEHEATVSRQLSRTRRAVRAAVERELRDEGGLTEAEVADCFASVAADPGPLDLQPLLAGASKPSERSV